MITAKFRIAGIIVALLGGQLSSLANARPSAGWKRVFDGRSLQGWTPKIVGEAAGRDERATFIVRNRAIRVSYQGYDQFKERFGHLFYNKRLRFFRLRLRYRFLEPGLPDTPEWARSNSGIMFLAQPPAQMSVDQPFPVSIEFQFLGRDGDGTRPTGGLCTPGTNVEINGKVAPTHCTVSNGPTLGNGQWVSAELDVLPSGEILHKINGKVVHRYSHPTLDPNDNLATSAIRTSKGLDISEGYVALQSEGHPIEFADVELQEL